MSNELMILTGRSEIPGLKASASASNFLAYSMSPFLVLIPSACTSSVTTEVQPLPQWITK